MRLSGILVILKKCLCLYVVKCLLSYRVTLNPEWNVFCFVSVTEYEIVTVTGNPRNGGTNANVFITVYGKYGQTPKLPLKPATKNAFDRNHTDICVLKTACVGPMTKVR